MEAKFGGSRMLQSYKNYQFEIEAIINIYLVDSPMGALETWKMMASLVALSWHSNSSNVHSRQ